MRIIRFEASDGPRLGLKINSAASYLDLSGALQQYFEEPEPIRDVTALAEVGLLNVLKLAEVISFINERRLEAQLQLNAEPKPLAPSARPPKIICLGLNYRGHAKELTRPAPSEPIFFAKASTSVIGPGDAVVCQPAYGRVDPEVELAFIISQPAKDVPLHQAMSYVGGYTVLNDFTAREMQARDMAASQPWYRSKSLNTFCPLGPEVVLKDEITQPGNLRLEMRVNGEVRQSDNTANLIFDIPFLVSYLSSYLTLEPGDIVATGTPEGIAPVKSGDQMEAWVEGIGVLNNPVEQA